MKKNIPISLPPKQTAAAALTSVQKAVILRGGKNITRASGITIEELNALLEEGWRIITAYPMGGGGENKGFASLVVLERYEG